MEKNQLRFSFYFLKFSKKENIIHFHVCLPSFGIVSFPLVCQNYQLKDNDETIVVDGIEISQFDNIILNFDKFNQRFEFIKKK
jgi:hypothetical protein